MFASKVAVSSVLCVAVAEAFSPAAFSPAAPGLARTTPKAISVAPSLRTAQRSSAVGPRMAFSFGKKEEERPSLSEKFGENPYRVFGVTEDAPYEEVEAAYKELCLEYKDDEKYKIKLEMMKEAIFDERLQLRMSGALKSKVQDSPFEAKLQVKKEPWWSKIAWLKKIVRKPEKKYATQCSCLMAAFIVAGLAAPQLASTTMGFGFLSAMGFLYNRGTPDIRRDDAGNPGESRPANYGALGKTVGLCMIGGGLGFFLSQIVIANVALPATISGDAVVNTFFCLGLLATALFFQVQDD